MLHDTIERWEMLPELVGHLRQDIRVEGQIQGQGLNVRKRSR